VSFNYGIFKDSLPVNLNRVFHIAQTENDTGAAQEALNELKEEF